MRRPSGYYLVAGIDLRAEMDRLSRLSALGGPGGALATRPPGLSVRRASRRPRNRLGFAVPSEWRLSVTAYPGIRPGDAQETLLHELVHLAVGTGATRRRWHGPEFKAALRDAMRQGYGLSDVNPRGTYHGVYADALEARRSTGYIDCSPQDGHRAPMLFPFDAAL